MKSGGDFTHALRVDPGDRDNVVGATSNGVYHREPDGAGGYHWSQKRAGVHSDVVVARTGTTTTFFAAAWGDRIYSSPDGVGWSAVGTSFPAGVGRISLAVRPSDASVLYALVATSGNDLQGVHRLDGGGGAWNQPV